MTNRTLAAVVTLFGVGAVPAVATADVSANVGFVTEYVFRGIYQAESSASAGVDYESGAGFYAGTWWADVGDGLEQDLYFGYGGGEDEFSWGVGYTGYFYTDDFDDTYHELNLGVGYGIFSVDVAVGEWDGFGLSQDYTFTLLTLSPGDGPYISYGSFGQDFDGDYLEFGYGTTVMDDLDVSVAVLYSDELDTAGNGFVAPGTLDTEWNIVFGITKNISFD